ncbi:hypothetical protein EV294_101324 [Paenibacillus sp. BK033]|nr:hypothetical protein EV294_101324 [Paenibacillus sp. BK033]
MGGLFVLAGAAVVGYSLAKLDIHLINRRWDRKSEAFRAEVNSRSNEDGSIRWSEYKAIMNKHYSK